MIDQKCLGIVAFIALARCALKLNDYEWATTAQKNINEVSVIFDRAYVGLDSLDNNVHSKLFALSKSTAKISAVFGVFGAIFSIAMSFIPGSDSPELKLMRSEFDKLSQKVDTIAESLKDTKKLIKVEAQRAAYVGHEHKINQGYSQLKTCLVKLDQVTCSGLKECKRKKISVAEGYIASMNVQESVEAILRGVTEDGAFSKSLLYLIKEESECNVPKINLFGNKIAALITKGMTVSMFHDLITKADYNILDGTVLVDKMLSIVNGRLQEIQDQCFQKFDYWMTLDVENSYEKFTSDIQTTNANLLRTLKIKYPWIYWHAITYKGKKEPETGPSTSRRRHLHSSSETHDVHSFVIPTNKAEVDNLKKITKKWKKIVKSINIETGVKDIEYRLKRDFTLENMIQSFPILQGKRWILGHYEDDIKQQTLGLYEASSANVFVDRPYQGFVVAVSFIQSEHPPKCTETCSGNGECYIYPYSMQTACKCKPGYNGEKCNSSGTSLKLIASINSILESTLKLPTFASIQHSIEDTQLQIKTSFDNIQKSIAELGDRIDEQFKNLGEFMSKKFEWFNVLLKYREAIENLNYFHSISSEKISNFQPNISVSSVSSTGERNKFIKAADQQIANFLLSPTGIQKWMYQINFLIVGRNDSQFNAHKPLLYMVMDTNKKRFCSSDYKKEITRTYRQLMLLQLQGYMLWSNAYSINDLDSSAISERYTKVLKSQQKYFNESTCQIKIPHSTNLQDCTDGFYLHKSLKVEASCKSGYFVKGWC